MPKLLSRSKHEEFESNSALQIRDKKERREENTKKMEPVKFIPAHTVHLPATVHHAARSCFLTLCPVCFNFCFFPYYPCNSFWFCFFFLVISYTLSTYISLSLYKLSITSAIEKEGTTVSPLLHFFIFLSFSLPFSATKHSSEDENSEDGWLDRLSP